MATQTDREILAKYQNLFDLDGDVTRSAMHFGLQVEAGWLPVIEQMCQRLELLAEGTEFRIVSVKQDMGVLRVVHRGGSDATKGVIVAACVEAAARCEGCGRPGDLTEICGWWMVRCGGCGIVSGSDQ